MRLWPLAPLLAAQPRPPAARVGFAAALAHWRCGRQSRAAGFSATGATGRAARRRRWRGRSCRRRNWRRRACATGGRNHRLCDDVAVRLRRRRSRFFLLRDCFQHISRPGNVRQINLGLDFFFAAQRARRFSRPATQLRTIRGGGPAPFPLRCPRANWNGSSSR